MMSEIGSFSTGRAAVAYHRPLCSVSDQVSGGAICREGPEAVISASLHLLPL
jgi:hypothetical protein